MPYVKSERRQIIQSDYDDAIYPNTILNAGDLNFAISKILVAYLKNNGTQYRTINDILGALEGAKLEFVRRIMNPYEDQKIIENGDIYQKEMS